MLGGKKIFFISFFFFLSYLFGLIDAFFVVAANQGRRRLLFVIEELVFNQRGLALWSLAL